MANEVQSLTGAQLRRSCDPSQFKFETTADLEPLAETIGQERAIEALSFGIKMQARGYGLYVLGPSGAGKHRSVENHLRAVAADRAPSSDWCYVNNFTEAHRPRAFCLPTGRAAKLRTDMDNLIEELRATIPAAFESEEYAARKDAIADEFKAKHEEAFEQLRQHGEDKDIALIRTPEGLALAPKWQGEVLDPEGFSRLAPEDKERLRSNLEELQNELQEILRQAPKWNSEQRERVRALDREVTKMAVGHLIDALRSAYEDLPVVLPYLDDVQADIVEHASQFMGESQSPLAMLGLTSPPAKDPSVFRRYQVNVMVDHDGETGAPVVYEDQPSQHRLVGRVEHTAQLGALTTDFTLIKPGALHRANGGYLILDARQLLMQPFAWEDLKRSLRSRQIQIESVAERLSLVSTVSLEPEPIPLDVKVVLVGEPLLYYMLSALDPEFSELFKVPVDFDDTMEWSEDNAQLCARMLATFAAEDDLKPLDPTAVARMIEHAARLTGDTEKLTAQMAKLQDLVRESSFWAQESDHAVVEADDVERAIDAQIRRADRMRERVHEVIERGMVLIDTAGERVGQVNGLSVMQLGGFAFGKPSRITARVRVGKGELVDIEREVELGGPLHSKGVLILAGYLGQRFAAEHPLSLSASLVFEQSYGGVDGDSASSAELYALLSALSGIPIKQSLAVTGSVNQHGEIQAIGGVNEKIEGFFDVCKSAGLDGTQGVLIPASNTMNLMLRRDVVAAAEEGLFHVYTVSTVDEGIALLTGVEAGEPDADGQFPEGTVNRRVADKLLDLATKAAHFGKDSGGEDESTEN